MAKKPQIVATYNVLGYDVQLIAHPLSSTDARQTIGFDGQKIKHPFETNTDMSGKHPLTSYTSNYCSPDAKEALEMPLGIYVKWDGSCGLLSRNIDGDNTIGWTMYTRLDLSFKNSKIMVCGVPYDTIDPLLTFGMIPCEADPRDICPSSHHSKLHYPFMVPIARVVFETAIQKQIVEIINAIPGQDTTKTYKWNLVAFQNAIDSNLLHTIPNTVMKMSIEQMGCY